MPIGTVTETAIEIGVKVVKKFFQSAEKEQGHVAIGLAVGYFYNFLAPVNSVIEEDELTLYQPAENNAKQSLESEGTTFESDHVEMQIIVPKRLDVEAFKVCEDQFRPYSKGFLYLKRQKRFYGVNYFIAEIGKTRRLTIVDLARPAMAIKPYYENIIRMKTNVEGDEKWYKTQVIELAAFRETLRSLQRLGYGVLVNKLNFAEVG